MEQRKGKRQLNQGVRVKRTEEEKRADRARSAPGGDGRQSEADDGEQSRPAARDVAGAEAQSDPRQGPQGGARIRERNFPESNGVAGQLLLFAVRPCGLLGRAGTRKLRLARRSHIRPHRRNVPRRKMVQKEVLPACLRRCGAGDCGDSRFVSRYTFGTTVIYEGQVLDTVASELEAKRVTASIADITSETLGKTFTFSDSSIQYTSGLVERSAVVNRAELEEELTDRWALSRRATPSTSTTS